MNRSQELHNLLVSVAVADALGSDIEFNPNPTKRTWLAEVNGTHPVHITDDTQMSLSTAEALLRRYKGNALQEAYLNWYRTQVARAPQPSNYTLMQEALLYRQEAPVMYAWSRCESHTTTSGECPMTLERLRRHAIFANRWLKPMTPRMTGPHRSRGFTYAVSAKYQSPNSGESCGDDVDRASKATL